MNNLIKILQGNCIDKIKELEDNSIDCVVSSPPYFGLRDYGVDGQFGLEKTYQDYIDNTVKVFETFKPKLKDTATIWWNIGDTYAMSSMRGKDSLFKSIDQSKSGIQNVKRSIPIGLKAKDLMMIPNRVAIALQDAGWYIRSEIIWHKPNPMPESIKDRPTSCHEKIWLITKSKKYYYDADAVREPCKEETVRRMTLGNKGKVGKNKNSTGWKQLNHYWGSKQSVIDANKGRNRRNVWTINTKPFKGAHFATFPKDLIEPCIKAGCPENGVVLDPFGGSGTTGIVAALNKRKSIIIELNPDYIEIFKTRIKDEQIYKR